MLFQRGTCKARDKCNQIHVDPAFIDFVTAALTKRAVSTCCSVHGAPLLGAGQGDMFASLAEPVVGLRLPDGAMVGVPADRIAPTFFWHRLARERRPALYFPAERLCQLHQSHRCKYGPECRNVHVCRDLWPQIAIHLSGAYPDSGRIPSPCATAPAVQEAWPSPTAAAAAAAVTPLAGPALSPPLPPAPESPAADPVDHMGLGPVGPARARSADTAEPHRAASANMHASLFASFPVLFAGLVKGNASSRSTTPDTLPSSPWNLGSELDITPTNLSINSEDVWQRSPPLFVTDEPVLGISA
eukprot:EG_transcript_13289